MQCIQNIYLCSVYSTNIYMQCIQYIYMCTVYTAYIYIQRFSLSCQIEVIRRIKVFYVFNQNSFYLRTVENRNFESF